MRCEDPFLIKNKLGLHARAATVLAQLAVQFDAKITLHQDDKEAAGDSVLALMLLESSKGKEVKVNSFEEFKNFIKIWNFHKNKIIDHCKNFFVFSFNFFICMFPPYQIFIFIFFKNIYWFF